jgi:hypothetical protein
MMLIAGLLIPRRELFAIILSWLSAISSSTIAGVNADFSFHNLFILL